MQAFDIHADIVKEYKEYLKSFIQIRNRRIAERVDAAFSEGKFLPDGLIQFNPSFATGASLADLESEGVVSPGLRAIFGNYNLYHHQVEALRMGVSGKSFVVTSGTGSGKSLTYLATIFDQILKEGPKPGLKAIIVYPMNALINSQEEEIKKYEVNYLTAHVRGVMPVFTDKMSLDEKLGLLRAATDARFPVSYGKYTGQEGTEQREAYQTEQPNIILTNYMMLELIMTRNSEKWLRESMHLGLAYLVFDELHTYRGRQGSDVSLLVRRIRSNCKPGLICIGTSATMASGDSHVERKLAVAKVASQIFSTTFEVEQIVEERLTTCTQYGGKLPSKFDLQEAVVAGTRADESAEKFVRNPLAIWIENKVALDRKSEAVIERGKPKTLAEIAAMLVEECGEMQVDCELAVKGILKWAEQLNIAGSKLQPRKSYLPFKIHQFISQTGNVYVTLESKKDRLISLEMGRYVQSEDGELPIFPILFSRSSGYDFICVRKAGDLLIPRDPDDLPDKIRRSDLKGDKETKRPKRVLTEDDFPDGYLILPEEGEEFWTEADEDLLPDTWFVTRKGDEHLDNFYEHRIPHRLYFDAHGNFSRTADYPDWGWFIAAPLSFDPSSGVIFDERVRENTKLMRLGNEGRSTATTITSFGVVKALHNQKIPPKNQKLLSFTDNRQDASLQAGHFNDFLMLARLRSAVYHALKEAPENRLDIDTIPSRVVKKLGLREDEYAREASTDPEWPDAANEKALKEYVSIRLLYDLKRGWRYNTPNLEQCALLEIDYEGLERLCAMDSAFAGIPLFERLEPALRQQYLVQILNFFRTSYAFQYYKLEGDEMDEMTARIEGKLDSDKLWSLDKDEKVDAPTTLLTRSVGKIKGRIYTSSIGPRSNLARYVRRIFALHDETELKGEAHSAFMEQLCKRLLAPKILKEIPITGENGTTNGYRLVIDKVIWKLGDGKKVLPDEVRTPSMKRLEIQPNSFFKKLYQQQFAEYERPLIGREHTGQLGNTDRITREDQFRKGEIAALFCSPTMELGIDINELNVVHMRNVPPNPANYAQRSGRAGRSGQAALVFTYCSNGSPHDRNYFKESIKMVSGTVVPPKIDLTNEELIRTHFNAYMLMEVGLSRLNLSAGDVLVVNQLPEIPLHPDILTHLQTQVKSFDGQWIQNFGQLLQSVPELAASYWFTQSWLAEQVNRFVTSFDRSFDRWRKMYLTANAMVERAHITLGDPTLKQDNPARKEAWREYNIGLNRKDILLNKEKKSFGGNSEFYVYRYLAAEGFLPGYGFTRLPIRTFLGYRHKEQGEFVSRSRFIALREFGPRNLIYHNGGKYEIHRMQVGHADGALHSIKISKETGYAFLDDAGRGVANDPITHTELKGQDLVEDWHNLMSMEESDARPKERISCEEEERMKTGYAVEQYFAFGNGIAHTKQVQITEGGEPILNLIYDQAAQLIQVNKGWRKSNTEGGFPIGSTSGKWKMAKDLEHPSTEDVPQFVRLYTTDTSDILYIQPVKELGLDADGVTSLAYALKRAIEKVFQVEEREITVWIMGSGEHRNILIYEAAEGSLGILSQLIENANDLLAVFVEAYKVVHFDPKTRVDTRPDLPRATYEDLLSYFNQRDHEVLNRFAIKNALERLMDCTIDNQKGNKSVEEQYELLLANYDKNSDMERKLIEFLYKGGYALPDRTQYNLADCYVNADFVYQTDVGLTLVFCDGSVHDRPDVKADDQRKRDCARDQHDVIEWHYTEPLEKLVERRKDIFRKVRAV